MLNVLHVARALGVRVTRAAPGYTFEDHGLTFRVAFPDDEGHEPPWENDCGHGPVSDWTTRDKRPGERVLCAGRSNKRYYDVARAVRLARRDGWGLDDAAATELAWRLGKSQCNDQWRYVGVVVTDVETGETDSTWGVESECDDYLETLAHEMASAMRPLAEAQEAAAIELATD